LLGLALLLGGTLAWQATKGWTPSKVDRTARAAVPLGSTAAEATAWLQANGFTDIESGSTTGLEYFETRDGVSLMGATAYVCGDAPNPNVDLLFDGTITVFFFFDENDRLVKIYVLTWICSF
jgi:hypothetical protein